MLGLWIKRSAPFRARRPCLAALQAAEWAYQGQRGLLDDWCCCRHSV